MAKQSLDKEDFRIAKHAQNYAKKCIDKDHADKLKNNLNGRNKFRTLNDEIFKENKIPTRILDNGEDIRSQKLLAEKFNDYFIKKVNDIRQDFDDDTDKAIQITEHLTE